MAASWFPPWMEKYLDSRFKWKERFVWWPVYSYESKRRIWLTKAWYGYRWVDGPAGEDPAKVERWLTDEEYVWFQMTNA